jgi:DGQHR domain-containing protein
MSRKSPTAGRTRVGNRTAKKKAKRTPIVPSKKGAHTPRRGKGPREILSAPAIEIRQSPGRKLFVFSVDGKSLPRFAAVSRVGRDDGDEVIGYQRPEVSSHIDQIRRYLESEGPMIPNAMVLAFDKRVKFRSANGSRSVASGRHGFLDIPLDEDTRPGWIVDGQQRAAAIREAILDQFPVFIVAFVTDSEAEQSEQFILVNSTKPLPTSLLYELLPGTRTTLPTKLHVRRTDAVTADMLNTNKESVFCGRIKTATKPDGKINQTAVMNMVRNSRTDGVLYRAAGDDPTSPDYDTMFDVLNDYWAAVADVFPDAWTLEPRRSRLTHGAGIVSMGWIMDAVADRLRRKCTFPTKSDFEKDLRKLQPHCFWTEGVWPLGPGLDRRWNELQNTPKDVQMLGTHLLDRYKVAVGRRKGPSAGNARSGGRR